MINSNAIADSKANAHVIETCYLFNNVNHFKQKQQRKINRRTSRGNQSFFRTRSKHTIGNISK